MSNETKELRKANKNLEQISKLLIKLVAIQLYRAGASQKEISKNMKISVGAVNALIKGAKRNTE